MIWGATQTIRDRPGNPNLQQAQARAAKRRHQHAVTTKIRRRARLGRATHSPIDSRFAGFLSPKSAENSGGAGAWGGWVGVVGVPVGDREAPKTTKLRRLHPLNGLKKAARLISSQSSRQQRQYGISQGGPLRAWNCGLRMDHGGHRGYVFQLSRPRVSPCGPEFPMATPTAGSQRQPTGQHQRASGKRYSQVSASTSPVGTTRSRWHQQRLPFFFLREDSSSVWLLDRLERFCGPHHRNFATWGGRSNLIWGQWIKSAASSSPLRAAVQDLFARKRPRETATCWAPWVLGLP
nr:unnamed protein product [Digitaria exilis]